MAETTDSQPRAVFAQQLRRALHHLYDSAELRKSPLLALFAIDPAQGAVALREALLGAIEALKPAASVPRRARPWRTYNTLLSLYVQQFSQAEVATSLAISTRQLRRQEQQALEALSDYLWARYDLGNAGTLLPLLAGEEGEQEGRDGSSHEQELAWLERSVPTEPADISEILQSVLKTTAPLLQALEVHVECVLAPVLPRVAVQTASMRQALLNSLTATVRCVPAGKVRIEGHASGGRVHLSLEPSRCSSRGQDLSAGYHESLQMARQLAGLSGTLMDVEAADGAEGPFTLRFALPVAEQMAVLVIDDNADTLQLFQRYLAGSHYPFIGARDPQQVLALIETLTPQIIVLDVMLPGVDGWDLLGRLREHPKTRSVPVIVCSILPEEQLALMLGAAAFMRKPVSRQALLSALDRLAGQLRKAAG